MSSAVDMRWPAQAINLDDQRVELGQVGRHPRGKSLGRQRHKPPRGRRLRGAVARQIGRSPSGSRTAPPQFARRHIDAPGSWPSGQPVLGLRRRPARQRQLRDRGSLTGAPHSRGEGRVGHHWGMTAGEIGFLGFHGGKVTASAARARLSFAAFVTPSPAISKFSGTIPRNGAKFLRVECLGQARASSGRGDLRRRWK